MGLSQESDEYDRIRGRKGSTRKTTAAVIFDLFYPVLVACITIAILSWFVDIPIEKSLQSSINDFIRIFH